MTFTTWGQTATHSTTVDASPAPTTTTCKVAAVGTLRVGMAIYIDVSATPEQTFITAIGGNNLTFSPALSGTPDVGGALVSYHQPLSNSKLNKGSVWSATNIADLTATNTTNMNDGTLAYVPGSGVFRLESASSESANGSTIIAPTTGPGRWMLDVSSGASTGGEDDSNVQMDIQDLQESILTLPQPVQMWTIRRYLSGISIAATSFQTVYFTLSEPGVTFNRPDAVQIQTPDYEDSLIQSTSYFRVQNVAVARFYNPTAGAITLDGGEWIINIWRNPNA